MACPSGLIFYQEDHSMDLLEKFNALTVEADTRISPSDRDFCEKHQAAYEAAIQSFRELSFFWADMEKTQREMLTGQADPHTSYMTYLTSRNGPEISENKINDHIESLHREFISNLVRYFNFTYNVSISAKDVADGLLPQEPERGYPRNEEAIQKYHEELQSISIQYKDIVEQIIFHLDRRSFSEQAFHELAVKCHRAAWNTYQKEAQFERKKSAIRFTGYCCRVRNWGRQDEWELEDGMKDVLRGAAHFETGAFAVYPLGFSDLLGYSRSPYQEHEFPTCKKVKRLKMFKSGRVDIYFTSETYAEEFVNKYLGTVC